ncbi:hypothetical protein GCM10022223_52280 [Kineosporia mesophila]|uniref:Uncharacterized protein n=1 Tax=Kineosporia mesophila TaxID=566012 RepID=A0ABP7AAZ9_9ACTN|nr:hypothetical protein [Kineosporia mesophila]MCD5351382.1 hypothetical protein [Kineosporia mesophila]
MVGWTGLSGSAQAADAIPLELGVPTVVSFPETTSKPQLAFTTTTTAGRLAVLVDDITVPRGVNISFTGPRQVSDRASGPHYFEIPVSTAGTWTVSMSAVTLFSGQTPGTGTARLTIGLAEDITRPLTVGTEFTQDFPDRGEDIYGTVPLVAGRRYGFDVRAATITGLYSYDGVVATLISPDGSTEMDLGRTVEAPNWAESRVIQQSGDWTLRLDPERAAIGSITAALVELTDESGGTLTKGVERTVNFTKPGTTVSLDVKAPAGRRPVLEFISRDLAYGGGNSDVPNVDLTLTRPDGTYAQSGSAAPYFEFAPFDVGGTWKLTFDPQWRATGSMRVKLTEVQDAHAALPLGRTGTASSSVRWQNTHLTFSGQAGQRLRLDVSDQSWSADGQGPGSGSVDLLFYRPDGSEAGYKVLYRAGVVEDVATVVEGPELDVSGIWTVVVNPLGDTTGTVAGRASLVK